MDSSEKLSENREFIGRVCELAKKMTLNPSLSEEGMNLLEVDDIDKVTEVLFGSDDGVNYRAKVLGTLYYEAEIAEVGIDKYLMGQARLFGLKENDDSGLIKKEVVALRGMQGLLDMYEGDQK